MLKYEEELHFDKFYEKLKSNSFPHKVIHLVWGVIVYILLFYSVKYILNSIPDFQPWGNFKTWFALGEVRFIKLDLGYFIYGIILTCYGTMRLSKITDQNHSVRNEEGSDPKKLLVDGYYARVRHPMYGTFILLQAGFMLSLRSFVGIIIAILVFIFQYANAVIEEKKKLIPIFGEEYRFYAKNVNRMLLIKSEIIVLSLAALLSVVGFAF